MKKTGSMISYLFSLWGEEDFEKKAKKYQTQKHGYCEHGCGGTWCDPKIKGVGDPSTVPGMGAGSREILTSGEEGNGCWKLCGPLKWQSNISLLQGHPKGKLFLQGLIRQILILFYWTKKSGNSPVWGGLSVDNLFLWLILIRKEVISSL